MWKLMWLLQTDFCVCVCLHPKMSCVLYIHACLTGSTVNHSSFQKIKSRNLEIGTVAGHLVLKLTLELSRM